MALPTYYAVGTASVANGGATVTFSGSAMLGTTDAPNVMPGDLFHDPAQPTIPPQRIGSVDYTAGTATLAVNWPGTTMSAASYEVRYVGIVERSTAQTRKLLEALGQVANTGIGIDAFGTLAGRDAYDTQAANFAYLSMDGDGLTTSDPVVFIKVSSASGDWSDAVFITGTATSGDFLDVCVYAEGLFADGEVVQVVSFAGSATFPAGLSGSFFSAVAAPTADAAFSLKKNGSLIGTITFAASSSTGTASFASGVTFGAGDVLSVVAPAASDATLSDVALTLRATRDASGTVAQTGTATLDFGAFPGATDAKVVVTGVPRIQSGSLVEAWLWPGSGTADHSADEHRAVGMKVIAGDVVAGTGFSIFGITTDTGRIYGQWNVAWRWS